MGPIWSRQDPGGPHVGPMNFAIWVGIWNPCQVYSDQCVSMIKSILSITFYAMYEAVCSQFTYFAFGECENIGA